jgi:hypothetical protein
LKKIVIVKIFFNEKKVSLFEKNETF